MTDNTSPTPTDDEREAMRRIIAQGSYSMTPESLPFEDVAYRLQEAGFGFRRSEIPEPSVDGRQVLAWIDHTLGLSMYQGGELTDYADVTVTALRTVRKMLVGTTRPDASWRSVGSQGEPSNAMVDPNADCTCGHGRHTHFRYTGGCGLCDCPSVRSAGGVR